MNLRQLEAFIKVSDSKSFSKSSTGTVSDTANSKCAYTDT